MLSRSSRALRRGAAVVGAAALGVTTLVTGGSAAGSSAAIGDADCPLPLPAAQITPGLEVDGLTVSKGTTPDPFTGEVVGVLRDGIAAGVDMILVDLSSPEIDRVGGIWSGMSGSPVYVDGEDGERMLLGAVAYGLSYGASPIAGVTPATEMYRLLSGSAAADARQGVVEVPRALGRKLVDRGSATREEVQSGVTRLALPVGISGVTRKEQEDDLRKQLGLQGARVYRASAAAAETPGDPSAIVPGGNIASSWAYGDFSAIATGTVTAVCGDEVLAFGHPMNFSGSATMTMHSATAVHILKDTLGAGMKLANPTGPVGTVDQDRLAAIKGVLGPLPDTSLISSTVTKDETGATRTGETHVSEKTLLPDAVVNALLANQDRVFDRFGGGSALSSWEISGTADGEPFTLQRSNRYSNPWDVSFETVFQPAEMVYALQQTRLADVEVDKVAVESAMSETTRTSAIRKVELKKRGSWRALAKKERIFTEAGRKLKLRVTLREQSGAERRVKLTVKVPRGVLPGARGALRVAGGERYYWQSTRSKPADFDGLLASLASAPRNDEVVGALEVYAGRKTWNPRAAKLAREVVTGQQSFKVRVIG